MLQQIILPFSEQIKISQEQIKINQFQIKKSQIQFKKLGVPQHI